MNPIENADRKVIKHLSTYGLALFLFLTPFEYPLADLVSVSPLRLVGLLAMWLALADILIQHKFRIDYRIIGIVLWLSYGLFSYFWAIDQTRWMSYYSIYLNNALMFLLLSTLTFTKYEVNFLKKSMVFGVGALLLYMTFVPNAVIYSDYQHRLTLNAGTEGLDQNYLAALMLVAFGLVFYDLCNGGQKKVYKLVSIVFCAAVAYYAFLTGSRSGLIALLLIVLLSLNTSWKTRLSIGIPLVLFLFVVLPLIAQHVPEGLLDRFSLKALTGQEAESGTRLLIWRRALESLGSVKVFVGYGAGASQTVIGNALGRGDAAIHNHYLAMVVETGIIGFLFMNVPIFKMFKDTFKKDKGAAVAFAGILLMAFFLDVVTTKFFWAALILLSICCASQSDIAEGADLQA